MLDAKRPSQTLFDEDYEYEKATNQDETPFGKTPFGQHHSPSDTFDFGQAVSNLEQMLGQVASEHRNDKNFKATDFPKHVLMTKTPSVV